VKTWRSTVGVLLAAAMLTVLAACSGNPVKSSKGSNGTVKFAVNVDFTGLDPVKGSFTDIQTGINSGETSCAHFATGNAGLAWQGPGPNNTSSEQVGGTSVGFLVTVATNAYHGPGTYTGTVVQFVSAGSDNFAASSNGSVTVKADGSGNASFSGAANRVGVGSESGAISWTCST
jgi:hypothetical protein